MENRYSQLYVILFIFSLFSGILRIQPVKAAPPLFDEIIESNTGIKSIDADIVQYINTPEHSREVFKGRYTADNSGRFKIDYITPSKQIVLNNGRAIYWYYPDDNILYIIGRDAGNMREPRINPLREFQQQGLEDQFKVDYLGEHLYGFFTIAHQFIVKDNKNDLTFDIWVHSKKKVLLTKIITNSAGIEIIKEKYWNYEKIKDVFFPRRIDVYARTNTGITRNTTEYYNIRLNYSIPDKVFDVKFPPDVEKKYLN